MSYPIPPRLIAPNPEAENQALVRQAASEEMARMAAINRPASRPQTPTPVPKAPALPESFGRDMAELIAQVWQRGLPFSRDELLKRGKAEFGRLLTLDAALRSEQPLFGPKTDFTSFESVSSAFKRTRTTPSLPRPSMDQELSGQAGAYRRAVELSSFGDLWKLSENEPRPIRKLHQYRDVFESLLFGRSLVTALGADGRVRHRFFADPASSDPARLQSFAPWRSSAPGRFLSVTLREPLAAIAAWLSGDVALGAALGSDTTEGPFIIERLATTISGLRQPPAEQLTLARGVLSAFLSGRDCVGQGQQPLSSWSVIGAAVRKPVDLGLIKKWRSTLEAQFPRALAFWRSHAAQFYEQKGYGFNTAYAFDAEHFEAWANALLTSRRLTLIGLTALALSEAIKRTGAAIVAILDEEIIIEVPEDFRHEDELTSAIHFNIERGLAAAFPGATFPFRIQRKSTL
jgi:hypothetical protein